jgi:hypothetical protein
LKTDVTDTDPERKGEESTTEIDTQGKSSQQGSQQEKRKEGASTGEVGRWKENLKFNLKPGP